MDAQEQLVGGIKEYYDALPEHQLAVYHRVSRERIRKWKSGAAGPPTRDEEHAHVINIGALGSGKTEIMMFITLVNLIMIPDNAGLMMRKRWEEIENNLLDVLFRLVDRLTGNRSSSILSKPKQHGASYVVDASTISKPSQLILKPEPDASSQRAVEDAIKGPEYGFVVFDEQTQLREIVWDTARGRLRRKWKLEDIAHLLPSITSENAWEMTAEELDRKVFSKLRFALGSTNPPFEGHWLHDSVVADIEHKLATNTYTPKDTLIIRSRMRDNTHLPITYVEEQEHKWANDPVKYRMNILGEDGVNIDGRPVFGDLFQSGLHTDDQLLYTPMRPLYVGLDFGWHHPAAVFIQQDAEGRVNVLGELMGEETTAKQFGQDVLDYMAKNFRPLGKVEYWGDPAGAQKTDKGDTTVQVLAQIGIPVQFKYQEINPGLDLIRQLMSELRRARPRIVVHRTRCPILVKGLIGGYHYKVNRGGTVSPSPNKDGFYEHVMDAFRYVVTGVVSPVADNSKRGWPTRAPSLGDVVEKNRSSQSTESQKYTKGFRR